MNGEGGDILASKRRIQHIQTATASANDPETPNHTVDSIILQSPDPTTTKSTTTATTNSATSSSSSGGGGGVDGGGGDTNLSALTPPPPPTIPTVSSTLQHAISTINISKSQFQAEYTALCDQHNLSAEVQVATQELLSTFLGSHMSQLVQEYEDKNRYIKQQLVICAFCIDIICYIYFYYCIYFIYYTVYMQPTIHIQYALCVVYVYTSYYYYTHIHMYIGITSS